QLEELLFRQRADDGAAAGTDCHKPFGGEPADRFADRPAADAELLRQRDLGELSSRLEAPGEDLLAQIVVGALPESQVPELRRAITLTQSSLGRHCIHFSDGLR